MMKKLPLLTGALAAMAVVLFALGAILSAVYGTAADPALYLDQSRAAVRDAFGLEDDAAVTGYIGLTHEAQASLAQRIATGMTQDTPGDLAPLSERETQHMRDVHGLIRLAGRLRGLLVSVAAGCCIAMAWTGAKLARPRKTVLVGALCGLGMLAIVAAVLAVAMNSAGFAAIFAGMHEVLFTNDLWLLDPATDVLIRMMPQLLFERAAMDVLRRAAAAFALCIAMGAAVYIILGGLMRRHFTEKSS